MVKDNTIFECNNADIECVKSAQVLSSLKNSRDLEYSDMSIGKRYLNFYEYMFLIKINVYIYVATYENVYSLIRFYCICLRNN